MGTRPFSSALAVAAGLHALIAGAIVARRVHERAAAVEAPVDELTFVTEEVLPEPAAPPKPPVEASPPPEAQASARAALATASLASTPRATTPSSEEPAPAEVAAAVPAPSASATSGTTTGPIDLGIGGYWKSVALGPAVNAPGSAPSATPETPASPDRILRDPLHAHDFALGIGPSGDLVRAAHDAASPNIAPDVGTAMLDVESDAAGFVTSARVISATPDVASWGDFARELVRLTASKRLRIPPGAHGVHARLRVVAEWTMPGGQHVETSPGAVPDDIPGGDRFCETSGPQRRCLRGSPVGATRNGFDLTNIGAKPLRIVRVNVEGETFL